MIFEDKNLCQVVVVQVMFDKNATHAYNIVCYTGYSRFTLACYYSLAICGGCIAESPEHKEKSFFCSHVGCNRDLQPVFFASKRVKKTPDTEGGECVDSSSTATQ